MFEGLGYIFSYREIKRCHYAEYSFTLVCIEKITQNGKMFQNQNKSSEGQHIHVYGLFSDVNLKGYVANCNISD